MAQEPGRSAWERAGNALGSRREAPPARVLQPRAGVRSVRFVDVGSTRLPLRAFSGALAAVAVAALAAPATAPAITRTVDYGQPGPAQMRAVRGWWNPNGGRLRMPARYVSRTRMSPRTQTICTEFTLYRFTAEYFDEPWAFEATSRSCRTAAPGRRAHF